MPLLTINSKCRSIVKSLKQVDRSNRLFALLDWKVCGWRNFSSIFLFFFSIVRDITVFPWFLNLWSNVNVTFFSWKEKKIVENIVTIETKSWKSSVDWSKCCLYCDQNLIKEKNYWKMALKSKEQKKKGRNKLGKISRSLLLSNLIDRLLSMPVKSREKRKKMHLESAWIGTISINSSMIASEKFPLPFLNII